MDQTTQYRQLQPEDRMTMASMRQQGLSARAMARTLGRSPSTITRELQRNTLTALPYASHTAQVACASRRVAARPVGKLDFNGGPRGQVLRFAWPEVFLPVSSGLMNPIGRLGGSGGVVSSRNASKTCLS